MDTPTKTETKSEEKKAPLAFSGDPMLVSPQFLRRMAKAILKQGESEDLVVSWATALLEQYPE